MMMDGGWMFVAFCRFDCEVCLPQRTVGEKQRWSHIVSMTNHFLLLNYRNQQKTITFWKGTIPKNGCILISKVGEVSIHPSFTFIILIILVYGLKKTTWGGYLRFPSYYATCIVQMGEMIPFDVKVETMNGQKGS